MDAVPADRPTLPSSSRCSKDDSLPSSEGMLPASSWQVKSDTKEGGRGARGPQCILISPAFRGPVAPLQRPTRWSKSGNGLGHFAYAYWDQEGKRTTTSLEGALRTESTHVVSSHPWARVGVRPERHAHIHGNRQQPSGS